MKHLMQFRWPDIRPRRVERQRRKKPLGELGREEFLMDPLNDQAARFARPATHGLAGAALAGTGS